ncbi:MAG: flavin reductase [Chromatiales bacterium]|jgi:flavin reductase (DIM6/NTAB) family NADH-FMN oxidoreductase RutF|nr:flavin reductase [Chromatiales bacterium]
MKKEVKIRPFWYSDVWLFPKLITIVTTLDAEGRVNAAPYSHIMQYDVMAKNARLIVGFRQDSHSYQNICATKEFVVNCPGADYLDDMMETARFYPEGVNELEHTRFTMIPSLHVKPPSIQECPQIAECVADEIIPLEKSTGIVIGRIKALVFDEELIDMDREARIRAMNLPIGLGDEDRQDYFHTTLGQITRHRLGEPPGSHVGGEVQLSMPWDADALQTLMSIPAMVRKMVTDQTEQFCRARGDGKVTLARFTEHSAEQGMTPELLERFQRKKPA